MKQKAQPLKPGDLIAVICPSGPVSPQALAQGAQRLESWGFRTKLAPWTSATNAYLAGADCQRADDFNAVWADPEVAGIICARGGYGAMRILPLINWDIVKTYPKFFCGFSDITALHIAIQQQADLITFHGPMVGAFGSATGYNTAGLQAALVQTQPLGPIPWPDSVEGDEPVPCPITIEAGVAEGLLFGGNLTLINALMGTRWEPDLTGKILMIEEVDEAPYRVDRLLTQLLLAGKLQRAAGILFGDSPSCMNGPLGRPSFSLIEVLIDRLKPLQIPVHYGFPSGHSDYRATLPLGAQARLDATTGSLTIMESHLG